MKMKLWILVLACMIGFSGLSVNHVMSAAEPVFTKEHARYVSKEAASGKIKNYIDIRVTKKEGGSSWFEKRELPNGNTDTFAVEFSMDTLMPSSYLRTITIADTKQDVIVKVQDKKIEAEITNKDGKTTVQSLDCPTGGFVIEPFLKKHISLQVGRGMKGGTCSMVTLIQGELKEFEIEWEIEGREKVTTAAGTFDCYKIQAGPSSWLMKTMVPPSITWFDTEGTHKVIRNRGKRTRVEKENIMDLMAYSLE